MATRYIQYCSRLALPCGEVCDAPVLLCLSDSDLIVQPVNVCNDSISYLEGTICQAFTLSDSCINALWQYTIAYDSEDLADPNTQLAQDQLIGVFCKDCLTQYAIDQIGNAGSLVFDEDANTLVFTSAHGCVTSVVGGGPIRGVIASQFIYGDGSLGDLTITTGQDILLPLPRTPTYRNITIQVGAVLHPYADILPLNGTNRREVYPLYVSDTLTIAGALTFNGINAPSNGTGVPGLGFRGNPRLCDGPGGGVDDGGYANNLSVGPNGQHRSFTSYTGGPNPGGKGGDAGQGGTPGLDPGVIFLDGFGQYQLYSLPYAIDRLLIPGLFEMGNSANYILNAIGGGSGGGGGGNGGHTGSAVAGIGGGGGSPGGSIMIFAKNIVLLNTGIISAYGGNGGNGSNAVAGAGGDKAAGGGGGGGGGGGLVYALYDSFSDNGTYLLGGGIGGNAGTSVGSGVSSQNGADGAAGTIIKMNAITGLFE